MDRGLAGACRSSSPPHLVEHLDGLHKAADGNGEADRRRHPRLLLLGIDLVQAQKIKTGDTVGNDDIAQAIDEQIRHLPSPRAVTFGWFQP